MIEVLQYVDRLGRNGFQKWYGVLDAVVRERVSESLLRLEGGNLAGLKSLNGGLLELRMDFGPGYRVYCGRDGDSLVILLCGGTKRHQQGDIERARMLWREYKARKRQM